MLINTKYAIGDVIKYQVADETRFSQIASIAVCVDYTVYTVFHDSALLHEDEIICRMIEVDF